MASRPPTSLFPPSMRSVLARVSNPLWSIAALVVIIWGLKEASAVLVPIVVAAMLAIICSPAVRWLELRRVPLVAAVLMVVVAMMGIIGAAGALVGGSLAGFSEALPTYRSRLKTMADEVLVILRGYGVNVPSIRPSELAGEAMDLVTRSMNALVSALSNVFLVMLTMVLILMEGKSVPGKLRAISGDVDEDISYFQQIAAQVQSYLAIKTLVSLATGLLVGVWCFILDIDFAVLWALLAFLLNYIPNIGSILAAIPAMLLALIQHGPGVALALGAGYVVINMTIGNVLEPWWMGRKLGLSTTVVFLSLAIWYEIWGPVGMLLSVPLTMVLKIVLEHSRDYTFIAQLLDSPEESAPVTIVRTLSMPPPSRPLAVAPEDRPSEADDALAERVTEPAVYDEPPDAGDDAPDTVAGDQGPPTSRSPRTAEDPGTARE